MTANVHLFVLCPPASGSTLVWRLVSTSSEVSDLPDEGQFVEGAQVYFGREPGSRLRAEDRWALRPPWDEVRAVWNKHWDQEKRVLVEKSPMNMPHPADMWRAFPGSRFLIMVRNPYAWLEGMTQRIR